MIGCGSGMGEAAVQVEVMALRRRRSTTEGARLTTVLVTCSGADRRPGQFPAARATARVRRTQGQREVRGIEPWRCGRKGRGRGGEVSSRLRRGVRGDPIRVA